MKNVIVLICITVVNIAVSFCAYAVEANVVFYVSYDNGIEADFSKDSELKPIQTKGELIREKGYSGEGLYIDENSKIQYSINGFNPERGSLTFWINPKFKQEDKAEFVFFRYYFDSKYQEYFDFYKANMEQRYRMFQYRMVFDKIRVIKADPNSLPENEWSFVVLTWNNKIGIKLYLNGKLSSFIDEEWRIPEQTSKYKIFSIENMKNKGAIIDEYKIYDKDLTENEIVK